MSVFVLLALLFAFAAREGEYWQNVVSNMKAGGIPYGVGILSGAFLTPLFLPLLPGRAFAVKGAFAGLVMAAGVIFLGQPQHWLISCSILLLVVVLSSYWGMKFTGASTYTSLSGVKKEMRIAVVLQVAAGLAGLGCWLAACFL